MCAHVRRGGARGAQLLDEREHGELVPLHLLLHVAAQHAAHELEQREDGHLHMYVYMKVCVCVSARMGTCAP